jgi:ubiquinone/menaquinone biosynthesis C-methylase UbiE
MDPHQSSPPIAHIRAPVLALFDQWASTDRAQQMAVGHQPLMAALLTEIAADPQASTALLDLGCGTGALLAQAAQAGFARTCGIDASTQMIEVARQTAPQAELRVGSFANLPWPSSSFDQVTTIEALYYCEAPLAALREAARVLKFGGRFDLIIDYYQDSSGTASWPAGLGFEITSLSAAQWTQLAAEAGLTNLRARRIVQPAIAHQSWQPSVWFPTAASYAAYLRDGALWITGEG